MALDKKLVAAIHVAAFRWATIYSLQGELPKELPSIIFSEEGGIDGKIYAHFKVGPRDFFVEAQYTTLTGRKKVKIGTKTFLNGSTCIHCTDEDELWAVPKKHVQYPYSYISGKYGIPRDLHHFLRKPEPTGL